MVEVGAKRTKRSKTCSVTRAYRVLYKFALTKLELPSREKLLLK